MLLIFLPALHDKVFIYRGGVVCSPVLSYQRNNIRPIHKSFLEQNYYVQYLDVLAAEKLSIGGS